ncbi:ABC transporter permease [Aquella oligotrophica]|uniref:Spermidine/putrescine ABC transporter permease n=1 Tax=Aquella oligotrophica TaxID=2067065 RepID=A0A2I7N640_9NEIS|nr:ABC transporter permease subunit [Aquella oligotrophica]AUR51937.1 spermidine/putrescine ABC transporter permease [Aquella oligotrophica]
MQGSNKISKSLRVTGTLVYLFLYLPLIVLIVYSFNDSRVNVGWVGFTLKWYKVLFADKQLINAAINSLIIALIASTVSVILGTLAGVALHKYKVPLLSTLVMIPVAAPELLVGVSLLLFFILINFTLGMASITLAHIAFCVSFVTIAVKTRMHGMDNSLLDAARDLGASPVKSFFLILIPTILPGVIAGWLMAFTLSIDDFVITFFTAGVGSSTLPLAIYSMLKMGVTPEVNAASTIIILVTLVLTSVATKLSPQLFK